MNTILLGGSFILGLILGLIIALTIKQRSHMHATSKIVQDALQDFLPQITTLAGEQTARIAGQKLEMTEKILKEDLEGKKDVINETIKHMRISLEDANKKLELAERERIGTFRQLQEQIQTNVHLTEKLMTTTEGLQKVLSNNQLRGQFGEKVAEDLLKMNGFVRGVDYLIQEASTEGGRPDFTIRMPNGMKINVDSKFPYQNLQKSVNTSEPTEKDRYMKLFEQDMKVKIREVTGRNYINPADNTVDFVILFVPNEMIFSYIYDKLHDIWVSGIEQKVVFAGPFSFTAILRMVRQAYENFHIQTNLQNIIGYIQVFQDEFIKYTDEFGKFGDRIDALQKQYQQVAQTRTHKLTRIIEKITVDQGHNFIVQKR